MYKLYFRFINNLNYNIIFLITEIIKKIIKIYFNYRNKR